MSPWLRSNVYFFSLFLSLLPIFRDHGHLEVKKFPGCDNRSVAFPSFACLSAQSLQPGFLSQPPSSFESVIQCKQILIFWRLILEVQLSETNRNLGSSSPHFLPRDIPLQDQGSRIHYALTQFRDREFIPFHHM